MSPSTDCVVVGSGPGGYVAAIRASQLGMKVTVVEREAMGGRCLNVACIPAKAVLRAADVATEIAEAGEFGINVHAFDVDFAAVQQRREQVVGTLTSGVSGLLKRNNVEVVRGEARLTADRTVEVDDGTRIAPHAVILATGSVGQTLPGMEFGDRIIGTEDAWRLSRVPATLAVVGAGASGIEIASAYARLGAKVVLVEALDSVLPTEDADICKMVDRRLKRDGIDVRVGVVASDVRATRKSVTFSTGADRHVVEYLVIAAGRAPDVAGLGLEEAGITLDDNGRVAVDASQRTSVEGIWAIGDITAGPALAHKASDEGVIAAEAAAGRATAPFDHGAIPRITFCTPSVASFGLTEAQAKAAGHDVAIGKISYGAVGAGTVYGDRAGLIKIVGSARDGELLGAHVVGAKSPELIQQIVNVRLLEGGFQELARFVHGHPTLSEGIMEAARAADGWLIHG